MDVARYEIVGNFISHGKYIFIVKFEHGTHIMPEEEWKWIFGQLRPERWENSKRVRKNKKLA